MLFLNGEGVQVESLPSERDERDDLIVKLKGDGLSVSAIARTLRVSREHVHRRLKALRDAAAEELALTRSAAPDPGPAPGAEGTGAGPVLLLHLIRYPLPDGSIVEIAVKPELAAEIHRLDERLRQRERRHRQREVSFTDAGIDGNGVATRVLLAAPMGSAWEGPRLLFSTFLGASRLWAGPPDGGPCPVCHGAKLEPFEYCLMCDRSGADAIIPGPGQEVVKLCRRAEKARAGEELPGGRGPSQPAPKKAKAKRKRRETDREFRERTRGTNAFDLARLRKRHGG